MNRIFKPRQAPLHILLLLLLAVVVSLSCKKKFDQYYNTGTSSLYVYDKLLQDSNFSIFAQGLKKAGLVQYINNGGLYTVFAPVNNAFRQYFASKGYNSINDVPSDTLFQLLNFHIVTNLWYYYTFQQRYKTYTQTYYLTRSRKFVTIDVSAADTLKINGVPVIKSMRDITADNAVIHGIGTVLQPLPNLEQLLQKDAYFSTSTFYKLMQVLKDSTYDAFDSYDKNGDGRIDSVFYKTYDLLGSVYTSLEFRQNSAVTDQGGDPVFNTIIMPSNDSLNALIAPALAKVNNNMAALSQTYAAAVLGSYFIYDTSNVYPQVKLTSAVLGGLRYYTINGAIVPILTAGQFIRSDVKASNGLIHLINGTFPKSDLLLSALGQASMDTSLSIFMAALQQAGLMGTYGGTGATATMFAPTNAAFLAAGFDVKHMLLAGASLTSSQFKNIMLNHIVAANLASASALTGSQNTVYGNSNTLTFSNGGATMTTNLGTVSNVTLPFVAKGLGTTTSGYVYKVDQVLIPNSY